MKLRVAHVSPVFFCGLLLAGPASGWEKYGIHSIYPVAISVQIKPSALSDDDLKRVKRAGFEYLRFGIRPPIAAIAKKNPDYSTLLTRIHNAQLKPIVTLFGGVDVWGGEKMESRMARTPQESADKFAAFALDTLRQYADPDILWELWNEPDDPTFLKPELLQSGLLPSIQAICASLKGNGQQGQQGQQKGIARKNIFGFGFSKMPNLTPDSIGSQLLAASLENCLDGVSVHPYRNIPETVINDAEQTRSLMQQYGRADLPMIASEWGYSSFTAARDQDAQAELILREYLSTVFAGIPLLSIYEWKDSGTDPTAIEHNYGLVGNDDRPKPALLALSYLLKKLEHTQLAASKKDGTAYQLTLTSEPGVKERRNVYMLWASSSRAGRPFSIQRNGAKRCIISQFHPQQSDRPCPGNAENVEVNAGSVPVAVTLYF
ncbi:hypothetical protein [Collimonas silvisoli]|uniref:hypothetical protein n=1 Tax=Collimonas silvisoli TaxID=2825884 RepID=UPI001B8D50B2|nr:hypothetical protein [Collimonas silvisoli]